MKLPVYLDNHATTPVDPRVVETILPYFTEYFGNAASTAHPYGWKAREAVEVARTQIAKLAGAEPDEVFFTSGATESINMVLKGIARQKPWDKIHIVTCATEHSAVLDTCSFLENQGAAISRLPVSSDGKLALDDLETAISSGADLVSLMHANNEIGVIHPVSEIGALCRRSNVPLHVDAAQSFGKISISLHADMIDFVSISGHKLYAPKGVGCLLVKRRTPPMRLTPLFHGGGHERGFRSGTVNVPGVVSLGRASEICMTEMTEEAARTAQMRDDLLTLLREGIGEVIVNGTLEQRLPGNLNISIPNIEGHLLLPALRDCVSVSSGSACTSAHPRPSHVLAALGRSDELAQASLRFGLGRFTTSDEISFAGESVVKVVQKLRNGPGGY